MESSFNRRAEELIVDGRYSDARTLLEAAIQQMPTGWTPKREDGQFVTIAFWDQEEFLAHSRRELEMKRLTKSVAWVDGSYSRAWYQLAVVASKEKRFENALFCIDCGVELEGTIPNCGMRRGIC